MDTHQRQFNESLNSPSYSQLASLAREEAGDLKPLRIALMGDASTQWLTIALRGYGRLREFDFQVYEAGFDQIDQEIANPGSGFYKTTCDYLVILETSRRLRDKFRALSLPERERFAQEKLEQAQQRHALIRERTSAKVIWFDCEDFNDGVYGGFSSNSRESFEFQLRQYNAKLWEWASDIEDLYVLPFGHLVAREGLSRTFDSRLFTMAEAPFGLDFVPAVARLTTELISTLEGALRKCLILDLDNTLWGGIVGDVGAEGIEIGSLGLGRAFEEFQNWILELKRKGIVLAVCSKNEEDNAREPFQTRPEMRLSLEDFAVFKANWKPKYENIAEIREVLNLGFDSLVFVDDNPVERDSVRKFLPDVLVPELPPEPEDYVGFLAGLNLFQAPQSTAEDSQRTQLYQTEAKRREMQTSCSSFEDYLASLEMVARFEESTSGSRPRVAQLFQRSNQFNTRTIRYSESQIKEFEEDPAYSVVLCRLTDRFGDHGIISCAVIHWRQDEGFLENWVMSCRVFNRQVEHFLCGKFAEMAAKKGLTRLSGERLPTKKNKVIASLFEDLGFTMQGDHWCLSIPLAAPFQHHLKEVVHHE